MDANSAIIYLLVYVDNIIITRAHSVVLDKFISLLAKWFSLKDLGNLTYFLGVEVTWSFHIDHSLLRSQCRYIVDLLARTKMTSARAVSSRWIFSITFYLIVIFCNSLYMFMDSVS